MTNASVQTMNQQDNQFSREFTFEMNRIIGDIKAQAFQLDFLRQAVGKMGMNCDTADEGLSSILFLMMRKHEEISRNICKVVGIKDEDEDDD